MLSEKLLALVFLLSALTVGCSKTESSANAGGPPPIPVKLLEIKPGIVEEVSEFSGSLTATQRVELKAELQGQVEDILVKPGSRVTKGTVIMTLQSDRVSPQLQNAQTQLTNSRLAYENVVQQLKVAESQREIAKSNLELARTNYERAQQLVNQGAIGQFTADQAKNQLDAATNALKVSGEQVKVAKKAITQAEVGIRQAEAQLVFIRTNLQLRQVIAPINGIVSELSVKEGESISSGQELVTLTHSNTMELRLPIPVDYSTKLRAGLPVELVDPDNQQLLATGKIRTIPIKGTSKTQTVVVKALFPNSKNKLQDGQYVKARVIWNKAPGVMVPTAAVTRSGIQSFVFVAQDTPCQSEKTTTKTLVEQQVVCQRMVTLGDLQGDRYPVKQGLKPGDRIAVSNLLKLKDDMPIQPDL